MTRSTCHVSVSLDGFIAGPRQARDNPLGVGGTRLHEWHWDAHKPGHGADVAARDDLLARRGAYVMGRNMFGPIRGEWDAAGGAATIRQAFAAGAIEQITLDVAPVLLGAGERLFDGVEDPGLEPLEAVHSPHATHIRLPGRTLSGRPGRARRRGGSCGRDR